MGLARPGDVELTSRKGRLSWFEELEQRLWMELREISTLEWWHVLAMSRHSPKCSTFAKDVVRPPSR